jgi:hypothetical protein
MINGSLYLVRWNIRPGQPATPALYLTDRNDPERDDDEEPREWWLFIGSELGGKFDQYDVIYRLDLVPIADNHPDVKTWEELA